MINCTCGRLMGTSLSVPFRFPVVRVWLPLVWLGQEKASGAVDECCVYVCGFHTIDFLIQSLRTGVFVQTIEWCVVVTTPDEVILLALKRCSDDDNSMAQVLKLVPTSFRLATENVRMLCVAGTESGRILLGGDDGCLYEMTYEGLMDEEESSLSVENQLEKFYDEGKEVPSVLYRDSNGGFVHGMLKAGKRTLGVLTTHTPTKEDRPRKCRKINRTSMASSWVGAVLPDFVVKAGSLFGQSSTGGGKVVRIEVDEDRQCVYTLSDRGWICSFCLGSEHGQDSLSLCAVMHTPTIARQYLEAVSRGQMIPPRSFGGGGGAISFPGGGSAAQAGVGGMDGARSILKAADLGSNTKVQHGTDGVLKPISIHVVSPTESQRLTLLAVTAGGLRLYISSLDASVIGSGPNLSLPGRRSPLAPSRTLTLCHIRSPPPADPSRLQDFSSVDSGVAGGMKPKLITTAGKIPRVDASFYQDGVFVGAVENKSRRQGDAQPVGDTIVFAHPDSVARKVEQIETALNKDKETLFVPGGVTETVSFPMVAAFGVSRDDVDPILPGGLVWDIASIPTDESCALKLSQKSQTPTDTELSIGLPPQFHPPSKVKARSIQSQSNGISSYMNGRPTNALVRNDVSVSGTAFRLLANVLTHNWLSTPLRNGLSFQGPSFPERMSEAQVLGGDYRLSKKDGSNGFSTTAAEPSRPEPQTRVSRTAKSARLRPWLLRPAAVPLNSLSLQHLHRRKRLVAINPGGLHYFGYDSVLSNLVDALMSAGQTVASDPAITKFFTSYSYKEGCAMCLALAVGCGPADGIAYGAQIRSRATSAMIPRSFAPRLVALADQMDSSISSSLAADSLAPPGYEFQPSELCNGLHLLFSRLVRPIWFKPVVVVTEGRTIKSSWSSNTRTTPAKVEVLLTEKSLEEIKMPLRNLQNLMKDVFSRAVRSVPGSSKHSESSMMDIDEDLGDDTFLTSALQYQNHLRSGSGGATNRLTPAEAESLARLIEEKNIHSLYRLLTRVVQLMNLISLLQQAQSMPEMKEVDWGVLHGLTVSQLVETPEGQDRLEGLLNSLVTASAADGSQLAGPSMLADDLANQFAEQCYLFFSPGSRWAYLGLRRANEALTSPYGSKLRRSLTKQAADHFRSAAKHWHSALLITGRALHSKGTETFEQIAIRALQFGSPLAKAVEALMLLQDVNSVVDVCLLTASNFNKQRRPRPSMGPLATENGSSANAFPWERQLYHKSRDFDSSESAPSSQSPSSPASPTQIMAYGAAVTSHDAVDTCYSLVFHHLSQLLSSDPKLADEMVSACADSSFDESFLQRFFSFMLENSYADTLLRIDSPELDRWLQERKDPMLLWRYYNVQGKFEKAAKVCWNRANDATMELPLAERIDCLTRALSDFKAALEERQRGGYAFETIYNSGAMDPGMGDTTNDIEKMVKEVSDTLQIAKLQQRVLHIVKSMPSELKESDVQRLAKSLVPVGDLFNDYAAALDLYEYCLLILHACRHDETPVIQRLWKNLICAELLPCATYEEHVNSFLQHFVSDLGYGEEINLLRPGEFAESLQIFERGDWAKRLEHKVVDLGKELYGTGADYVFPVDFLLSTLESLRECASGAVPSMYSLDILAKVGVPYLLILDSYESFVQQNESRMSGSNLVRLEYLGNMVDLIDSWVATAQSSSFASERRDVAEKELSRAMASGHLMPKMDSLRAKLETMGQAGPLLEQVRDIEDRIRAITRTM